jgi:kinesin family protein C2/C3
MEIKQQQAQGGKKGEVNMEISGLTWEEVGTFENAMTLLAKGHSQRVTAATLMNSHSSRSHLLVYVGLHGFNPTTGISKSSRLCLVDLAGSERISRSGAEGNQLKEAQAINKSLSGLGDVLHSLQHKAAHVPYRNSKLTFALQDLLSGSSKVLSIVQVSPAETNAQESLCTLEFAARVSQISMVSGRGDK